VSPARAHLEYTLYVRLAQIEPPIWRRIVVPANLTLHQWHQVLQVTMSWTHSHLHQFIIPGTQESIYYGEPSPEDDYFHKDDRRVLPLTMVENSTFLPTHLTFPLGPRLPFPSRALHALHFKW